MLFTPSNRALDSAHTCLVMASMWNYLIDHFGDENYIDVIPWYDQFLRNMVIGLIIFFVHRTIAVSIAEPLIRWSFLTIRAGLHCRDGMLDSAKYRNQLISLSRH